MSIFTRNLLAAILGALLFGMALLFTYAAGYHDGAKMASDVFEAVEQKIYTGRPNPHAPQPAGIIVEEVPQK